MAKNLMILGTASTVGKSIVTAALCRIFKQDGYKVAPFKSQNMALNSYVTKDGKEMGRAQVVQAEAAGIEPMVEMNPILIKPTSDMGSQIIVNGKVYKNMKARDYFRTKQTLRPEIMAAYETLDKQFDIVLMEGAGSPAEINLKQNDIVNMGMAEMVDAPVILVGDIDKGGVFAALYGTVMLLEPSERARIKGYIINKFRGDVKILEPGLNMFYEKLPIPCLGVIPYTPLNIDDEDSVTTRFTRQDEEKSIAIGVIRLPYMSNFTDFTSLEMEEDVTVRYITNEEIGDIDILIIPGSKNTLMDMKYLHNSKLTEAIYRIHRKNIPIIGICGGFQMLGVSIEDPYHVETNTKEMNGLGLLEVHTTMLEEKKTLQSQGIITASPSFMELEKETKVSGYEIHMGETSIQGTDTDYFIKVSDGRLEGAMNLAGNVIGTYFHGIFDNTAFRTALLNPIRRKKGLEDRVSLDYHQLKEAEYDKLAKVVRESIQLDQLKEIMGVE